MGKHIGTCGHELQSGGVPVTLTESKNTVTYGSYCPKCAYEYWRAGEMLDTDLLEFVQLIRDDDLKRVKEIIKKGLT